MSGPDVDAIVEALALASTGKPDARVEVDPSDLDDPLALVGNAINLLLEDLAYRQQEREEALRKVASIEAKQEFLSYLSHDMQTPLAMLLGGVELLDTSASADELRETVPLMRQAIATLQRFVQQFLDFAQLEADQPLVVDIAPADVLAILARVTDLFADRSEVRVTAPEDLPKVLVDAGRTEQIVANLLGNAFKYARNPWITVEVTPDGRWVAVTVADEGPGMSAEELDEVFGKFVRGPVSARAAGTGLGLFISRALAEAQGAELLGASVPGEGSRFTLRLPRTRSDVERTGQPAADTD